MAEPTSSQPSASIKNIQTSGVTRIAANQEFQFTYATTELRSGGVGPSELVNMIDDHLNMKFDPQAQRGREDATAKKGNRVFAEDVGTPIYDYLDTIYWRRIVEWVEYRDAPIRAMAREALAAAQATAAAAAAAAQTAQAALNRAMTPGPPGPPGPAGATGATGAAGHTDTYVASHADTTHADTTHTDTPHSDTTHTDASHSDTAGHDDTYVPQHTDTPHSDIPHFDTEIVPHTDMYTPHSDFGGGGGGGGGGGTNSETFF